MADKDGIRVEGAVYSLGGKPVLNGVHAVFPAGTVTLLLGRNGCGKTMLLELVAGLRKPDRGAVFIDGQPLWQGRKPDRALLFRVGLAMQNPEEMLFARTVREEFAYALKPYRWPEERRRRAAHRAAGWWLAGKTGGDPEKGADASGWFGRDPLALSGGQRRRLAMALTEVPDPDWLLLDEPTVGLDRAVLERLRMRLAERRTAGKGAIIVTHDPEELMDVADRIVLMRDGRVTWAGTPGQLAGEPGRFAEAGLEPPERLRTMEALRNAGIDWPDGWRNGWPDAESLADALAARLASAAPVSAFPAAGEPAGRIRETDAGVERATAGSIGGDAAKDGPDPAGRMVGRTVGPSAGRAVRHAAGQTDGASPLAPFDPRALWLACLAVTAAIGMQSSWAGWLAGAVVSVMAIRFSRVSFRVIVKPAKALMLFTLVTSVAAGWQPASGVPFDTPLALDTFRRFSKLVMMALLGFSLMAGISPLRLKQALERGLAPLAKFGVPVGRFALASALLLRFLPLLLEAWDRFARIAASRGKRPLKPGSVPFALIAMTVVPFLLHLIRLGDALAAMLAVRGVGQADAAGGRRLPGITPAFTRRDAVLLGAAALLFLSFLLMEKTF